jgi:hypothetical protein
MRAHFFFLLFCGMFFQIKCLDAQNKGQKICLAMATRDDEAVIGDCLRSVQEIIDCVVICDLGSQDRTRLIVESYLKERGIPGAIVCEKSVIGVATKIVKSFGWDLSQTYLLILRPDAICEIHKDFSKANLKKDAYLVLEPSEDLSHFRYKPNFLRASINWAVVEPYVKEPLKTFCWNVNPNEGYQSNRVNKKMRELLNYLKSDPEDTNSLLTLAGFYKKLRCYDQAVQFYQKCAVKDGNSHEVWFARYMLGQCLELQGDVKNSLHWYLEAYRIQPDRPEPLHRLFMQSSSETDLGQDIIWILD